MNKKLNKIALDILGIILALICLSPFYIIIVNSFKTKGELFESTQIFDWKSGDERERRYLFHEYLKEDHMVEYRQPGQAHDTDAMYETGKVYER